MHLTSFLSLAAVAAAAPLASELHHSNSGPSAIYFLLNDPNGASVLSAAIQPNGLLSNPQLTPTGGKGLIGLNATTNQDMTVDSTFSADTIIVRGNKLFAVNPGSADISAFSINPRNPQQLTPIGKPVSSLGQYPHSVDYSPELNLLCATNTGAVSGVACWNLDSQGLTLNTSHLLVPGVVKQTTPPAGPPHTTSEVLFSPNSDYLTLTVKGNYSTNTLGYTYIFPWNKTSHALGTPVISRTPGIFQPFGFQYMDEYHMFVADTATGAGILTVNPNDYTVTTKAINVAGQSMTCWTQIWRNPQGQILRMYAMDAGEDTFYQFSPTGTFLGRINNGLPLTEGNFDSFVVGNLLYLLTGGTGVDVFDLNNNKRLQFFNTSSVAPFRPYYEGMAYFKGY